MAEEVGLFRASMPSTLRAICKKHKCSNLFPTNLLNPAGSFTQPFHPYIKKAPIKGLFLCMAEEVGFEPTKGYKPLPVFKTGAFNRSATLPNPSSAEKRVYYVISSSIQWPIEIFYKIILMVYFYFYICIHSWHLCHVCHDNFALTVIQLIDLLFSFIIIELIYVNLTAWEAHYAIFKSYSH